MLRCILKLTQHIPKYKRTLITSYTFQSIKRSNNILHHFTTTGKDDESKEPKTNDDDEDPFGIKDENILPPKYKRDPITGKFTGETEVELSEEEEKILNMSDEELLNLLEGRVVSKNDWDEDDIAHDIRDKDGAMNVLGRRVLQKSDETSISSPLSSSEFEGFRDYLKNEEDVDIAKDDIDISDTSDGSKEWSNDQDLSWIAKSSSKDAWLEEIMPYDLAPQRKVNRRDAKPIPKVLLHHNNIELLRRYSTPGGQILPRKQSRLGAKDQRKIAKLIKRARALGLIPYIGQWKLEDKGMLEGGKEKYWWEEELEKKGFKLPTRWTD